MKFLSVCSGIEAASIAWEPLGWKAIAFSEIDKFPSAVLAHHWPDIPNLGDMTKYNEWTIRPNLIVGGTPCQSYSVAGLRKGLKDPRGNLTLVFLGMVKKFNPTWVVWENVPGVLSDKTNAFGQFINGLVKLGYDCAWRVLDAKHFGVPQRRRRVFLVANTRNRPHPGKVLLQPECLQGYIEKNKKKSEINAPMFNRSIGNKNKTWWDGSKTSPCLTTTSNNQRMPDNGKLAAVYDVNFCDVGASAKFITAAKNLTGTLTTNASRFAVNVKHTLRRLTPIECERLQGFPDNHTQIPWRGKTKENCPDGPRYKACGNSMAVPVMRWIGEQIQRVENECGK